MHHTTHRLTPGLRFEKHWKYQTLTPCGDAHWTHLPLATGARDDLDPNGAWWCSRRCAAVLLRRPWQAMRLPYGLPARPSSPEVAQALGELMPGWDVALHGHTAKALPPCAQALDRGGSALLLLQSVHGDWRPQRTFWCWVVGIELQDRGQRAVPASAGSAASGSRALLTMPFGWTMSSASSYMARVRVLGTGLCDMDGVAGQRCGHRCLATLTLAPPDSAGHAPAPL